MVNTPEMGNLGDHALSLASRLWLKEHFKGMPVVEIQKTAGFPLLVLLRILTRKGSLVFLSAGGDMGDMIGWPDAERRRRKIITLFRSYSVISLPQSIAYSDTPRGREEQRLSSLAYSRHKRLTVLLRDEKSVKTAKELFPSA